MRATILIQAFCNTRSDLDMEKTVCPLPIRCEAKTSFLYISKSYLVFLLFKNFHCLEFSLARTKINFVPKPALYFIGYLISTSLWQVRQTQTQIIWRYSPNFLSKVFHFLQLIGYCCYCYNSRHILTVLFSLLVDKTFSSIFYFEKWIATITWPTHFYILINDFTYLLTLAIQAIKKLLRLFNLFRKETFKCCHIKFCNAVTLSCNVNVNIVMLHKVLTWEI